jgi:ABC-type phosphate transport system substrate-binding protein
MNHKNVLIAVIFTLLMAASTYSQIAVIANKNVDLVLNTNTQVSDIFTLEVQMSKNNVPIVAYNLKSGDAQDKFYAALNKTPTELKKIWMKAQLSGQGKAPESLESESAMIAQVASTPGAVGYVSESKVTADVKVLFIIK